MRQNSGPQQSAESHVKDFRRRTRRKFSAEEKIRIVLAGLRGEASIAELYRQVGAAAFSSNGAPVERDRHGGADLGHGVGTAHEICMTHGLRIARLEAETALGAPP